MSENKLRRSKKTLNRLTVEEFMAAHANELDQAMAEIHGYYPMAPVSIQQLATTHVSRLRLTESGQLIERLKQWQLLHLMKTARTEGCPEGYRELLEVLLWRLGVSPPLGVLISTPGTPGRPRAEQTSKIFRTWHNIDRPSLTRQLLARVVFGYGFESASSGEKKKMVDKCRQAVLREQKARLKLT